MSTFVKDMPSALPKNWVGPKHADDADNAGDAEDEDT